MKVFLPVLLLFVFTNLQSQSLKPKAGFGNAGKVTMNFGNDGPYYPECMALQADGKAVIGGSGLTRLDLNGDTDISFGFNGQISSLGAGYVPGIAVQADNKIIYGLHSDNLGILNILLKRVNDAGVIDSSFNNTGIAAITEDGNELYLQKIKIQPDGKILVLASASVPSQFQRNIYVARLNADGTPDLGFNSTGKIIIDISSDDIFRDIALQSDGKIIVAGSVRDDIAALLNPAALRLNSDGTRDMSFSENGLLQYISGSGVFGDGIETIHVYSNNKILLAGNTNSDLLLIRLQSNGKMDSSFNETGKSITDYGDFSKASRIHILPDQKILVTGTSGFFTGNAYDYTAYRFTDAGVPDPSFNGTGKVHLPLPSDETCTGSIVKPDGTVLLIGRSYLVGLINTARINTDGTFNMAHGPNGIKYASGTPTYETVNKVFKMPDGKVLTVSKKYEGELDKSSIVLTKFEASGSPDNTFGTNGNVFITDNGFLLETAIQQTDGKIVLAGFSRDPNSSFEYFVALVRLNTNGSRDLSFGTSGMATLFSSMSYSTTMKLAVTSDNKIIAATYPYMEDAASISLRRFLANGTIDNSFGTGGVKEVPISFTDHYLSSVALQNDGKILLSGSYYGSVLSNFYCMRLTQAGNIDNSFATGGIFESPETESGISESISVNVTKDQKIILTGYSVSSNADSIYTCVLRLLPGGTLDPAFNATGIGKYIHSPGNFQSGLPMAVAIHPDSSIYIAGSMLILPDEITTSGFIIRIKQDGRIDSSLSVNGDGWNLFNQDIFFDYEADINIDSDSIIYIGGCSPKPPYENADIFLGAFKRLPGTSGRVYVFNGDGLWNNPANWTYSLVPPNPLPNGSTIIVDPAPGSTSILNTPQSINPGGSINVKTGSKLIIQGNLNISN